MRIAVIAPPSVPVPPPFYGGTEAVVDTLCRGYAAAGHDVVLFASADSTCPVEVRSTVDRSDGELIGQTEPELAHVLVAYDDAERFDIVHDHTLIGPILAGRTPQVPVASTIHLALQGNALRIYEHVPDNVHLIAISEAQRRPVPNLAITSVIHHGINPADLPVGAGDGDFCLFLGRMSPDKGARWAIAAAKKAGMPLILAGKMRSVEEITYFEEQVEPALSDDVRYLGEIPHQRKVELLGQARALLFPTLWNEPFGMVMLEALACGTPVISTMHGAVPEVIADGVTGFLCADEGAFAEAVGRIGSLDRRVCREAVEGYFSADRMVRSYLAVFDLLTR